MQINNVDLRTGNVSFLALQSIKFKNRYKKLPELQLKLLDSIASNMALNQIYRKYDVDIIFKTYKDIGKYFSIMEVWCNNDKISFNRTFEQIINPGYQFSIDTFDSASSSLVESTDILIDKIQKSNKKLGHYKVILDKIFSKENSVDKNSTDIEYQVRKKIKSMIYK